MTNNFHALRAGSNASRNEEARLQPGFRTNRTTYTTDCAGRQAIEQHLCEVGRKRFQTLLARFALTRCELTLIAAGRGAQVFRASRWGMSRTLIGLTVVELFGDRAGAPS